MIEAYRGPMSVPIAERSSDVRVSGPDVKATLNNNGNDRPYSVERPTPTEAKKLVMAGLACAVLALTLGWVQMSILGNPHYNQLAWQNDHFLHTLLSSIPIVVVSLILSGWGAMKAVRTRRMAVWLPLLGVIIVTVGIDGLAFLFGMVLGVVIDL